MGAKAFISLGEMYEIFIQVTATGAQGLNERNTVTILDSLIKHAMRDNADWEIRVKSDYEDSQSLSTTARNPKRLGEEAV